MKGTYKNWNKLHLRFVSIEIHFKTMNSHETNISFEITNSKVYINMFA